MPETEKYTNLMLLSTEDSNHKIEVYTSNKHARDRKIHKTNVAVY